MDTSSVFHLLTQLLHHWQPIIQFRPFVSSSLPSNLTAEQKNFLQQLQKLNEAQLQAYENDDRQWQCFIGEHAPSLQQALQPIANFENSLRLESQQNQTPSSEDRFFNVGIPGRKWQQIQSFVAAMPLLSHPIVDWCSGKGHLARLMNAHHQQPITCLEYNAHLCSAGQSRTEACTPPITFVQHDVLQSLPDKFTDTDQHFTALHACGDLHLAFLKNAVQNRISGLTLSPCCYQKTRHTLYAPLSSSGAQSSLRLSRQDLALAVAETVTGGARTARLRQQERLWRVAFDLWQKEQRHCDQHLPLPSCPKAIFSQSFEAFCRWALERKEIDIGLPNNPDELLHTAEKNLQNIRKLELAQQPLKRPLELWLILDRVLYLQDNGYDCSLSIFCDRQVTPRNFLIQATRKASLRS